MSAAPLRLTFVQSAAKVDQLLPASAEIAFVGRSNVGKSSLINALANQRQLAQVSNTPGRTRLLNLFVLTLPGTHATAVDRPTVVDLPGYGYAAVSASQRTGWQAMIEGYLQHRDGLRCVLVLVDTEIGPTKLDVQMLTWLHAVDVPYAVVATKTDKVGPSKLGGRKAELAQACGLATDDVLWVSASTGKGLDALRSRVLDLLRSP
jgi:GTP-binding protein